MEGTGQRLLASARKLCAQLGDVISECVTILAFFAAIVIMVSLLSIILAGIFSYTSFAKEEACVAEWTHNHATTFQACEASCGLRGRCIADCERYWEEDQRCARRECARRVKDKPET
jgi:hypothetical protein